MRVPARRVLVLGGYGTFGRQACAQLVRRGIDVVVAGRSLEHAQQCAAALRPLAGGSATPLQMDGGGIEPGDIAAIGAAVVINASGPFQLQDYGIARASIAAGAHYVDLADARTFVVGIGALDAQARRAGVLVAAGASTVPALSSAVIDAYAPQFGALAAARIVIAPSNSFDPGLATARSILGMLGKPFPAPQGAATRTLYGWQGLRRWRLPGLGARWLGLCEVPDLDVLPPRYPGRPSVRVYAALEIGLLHLGLWGLSWLVRAGLLRRPERLAAPLLALKRGCRWLGSDVSGMGVYLEGTDREGGPKRLLWRLVARRGCGPVVPAMPSVLLARRLLAGTLDARGAGPCVGLLTLPDFLEEFAGFDITAGIP